MPDTPPTTAESSDPELSQFDADQLNTVAHHLNALYGYLPLDVRFRATAAALAIVGEYTASAFDADPATYVDHIGQLKAAGDEGTCSTPAEYPNNFGTYVDGKGQLKAAGDEEICSVHGKHPHASLAYCPLCYDCRGFPWFDWADAS